MSLSTAICYVTNTAIINHLKADFFQLLYHKLLNINTDATKVYAENLMEILLQVITTFRTKNIQNIV